MSTVSSPPESPKSPTFQAPVVEKPKPNKRWSNRYSMYSRRGSSVSPLDPPSETSSESKRSSYISNGNPSPSANKRLSFFSEPGFPRSNRDSWGSNFMRRFSTSQMNGIPGVVPEKPEKPEKVEPKATFRERYWSISAANCHDEVDCTSPTLPPYVIAASRSSQDSSCGDSTAATSPMPYSPTYGPGEAPSFVKNPFGEAKQDEQDTLTPLPTVDEIKRPGTKNEEMKKVAAETQAAEVLKNRRRSYYENIRRESVTAKGKDLNLGMKVMEYIKPSRQN